MSSVFGYAILFVVFCGLLRFIIRGIRWAFTSSPLVSQYYSQFDDPDLDKRTRRLEQEVNDALHNITPLLHILVSATTRGSHSSRTERLARESAARLLGLLTFMRTFGPDSTQVHQIVTEHLMVIAEYHLSTKNFSGGLDTLTAFAEELPRTERRQLVPAAITMLQGLAKTEINSFHLRWKTKNALMRRVHNETGDDAAMFLKDQANT